MAFNAARLSLLRGSVREQERSQRLDLTFL
jgi:hypothetical protein